MTPQLVRRHSLPKLLRAFARVLLVVVCGCAPDASVPGSWQPAIRGRPGPFASEVVYITLSSATAQSAGTAYRWHIPVCINLSQKVATPLESIAGRGESIVRFEPARQLLLTTRDGRDAEVPQAQSQLSLWHLTDPLSPELLFSITLEVQFIRGAWVEPASGDLLVWGERAPPPRVPHAVYDEPGLSVLTLMTAAGGVSWQREFASGFTVLDGRYNPDTGTCLLSAWDYRRDSPYDGVPTATVLRYDVAADGLTSLLPSLSSKHNPESKVWLHPTQLAAIVRVRTPASGGLAVVLVQLEPEYRLETWPLWGYSDAYWVAEREVAIVLAHQWFFGPVRWKWTLWDIGTPLKANALTWAPLEMYGQYWSQFRSSEGRLITVSQGNESGRSGIPLPVTPPFELFIGPTLPLDQESSRGFVADMRPILRKFAPSATWFLTAGRGAVVPNLIP